MKTKLHISREYHHHHSDGILYKHNMILGKFKDCLDSPIELEDTIRTKNKRKLAGISADSVNIELRRLLSRINDIKYEVNQHDGVYYFTGQKHGFDFALIDDVQNIHNLSNLCFGRRALRDGEKAWNKFLDRNPSYKELAKKLNLPNPEYLGKDLLYEKEAPIILGEIQFGNWALAYRDFFKVLKANILTSVDVLIYMVPDGKLHSMLSDGIVNFEETSYIIKEFEKVITVPIWLIGLDID